MAQAKVPGWMRTGFVIVVIMVVLALGWLFFGPRESLPAGYVKCIRIDTVEAGRVKCAPQGLFIDLKCMFACRDEDP